MTVVIADTSPINYLVLIGEIEILLVLYGTVVIPSEVAMELADPGAPAVVQKWIRSKPEWLELRSVPEEDDDSLMNIDAGERAAILLAQREPDALLLMDDSAGRSEATRRHIPNTGTLGVLRAAADRGLLDLRAALNRLALTNFRVSAKIIEDLLG